MFLLNRKLAARMSSELSKHGPKMEWGRAGPVCVLEHRLMGLSPVPSAVLKLQLSADV